MHHSSSRVIAIANYDFRASGTVAKSIEIAGACAAAGLPVELWAVRESGPLRRTVPEGVRVVVVGRGRRRASRGADLALAIPALASALRKRRPRVLLSGGNHLHLPVKIALALSGRRRAVRLLLRASNSSKRPGERAGEFGWGDSYKYRGADLAVAVSEELADEIRSVPRGPDVLCIPNGVDSARVGALGEEPFDHPFLARDAAGVRAPVLASMGRISRQKGFDVLIRALAALPVPARLLIVGHGARAEVDALRDLAAASGVADRVDFLGYRANPFAVLARADLYVSASRWEGASNALLEALALGLPLVATDCPTGNREILGGGRYGHLAPVEDPRKLAEAILAELAAARSRETQRERAQQLDLGRCTQEWIELLRAQLQTSPQRMR
ncbi:MAG TPA: glycosyltransferase [Allosphingosinicella sp.]